MTTDRQDRMQLKGLARLGRFVARHHRWTALVWVLILVGGGYLGTAYQKSINNNVRIPNTDSQAAYDLLGKRFSSQNAATATVVFAAPAGAELTGSELSARVESTIAALEKAPGVASVSNPISTDPREALEKVAGSLPGKEAAAVEELARSLPPTVSDNGRVAVATVNFDDTLVRLISRYPVSAEEAGADYANPYSHLEKVLEEHRGGELTMVIGGEVADTWNQPVSWWASHADEVGLAMGALLLLVAFGSLFGMLIPIVTALFGAVTASGLVYLLGEVVDVSSAAPPVTLMIALGVGLDYSLLIVTRYRQYVAEGYHPHDAAGLALGTAGKASLFAGLTVCVALLGLVVVPIPLVQTLGLAAAVGVMVMILAAMTLLPTLLGFAGGRIDRVKLPHSGDADPDPDRSFWGRFATTMARNPWVSLTAGTVVLLLVAVPFLRIHFGMPDDGSMPRGMPQQQAFELTDRAFGPGSNGPLVVAVGIDSADPLSYAQALQKLEPVSRAVGALRPPGTVEGIQYSLGPVPNDVERTTAVIYEIIPTSAPDDKATTELVHRLRDDLDRVTTGSDMVAHVGGTTATLIDLTDLVTRYLPWVVGTVVLGAFVLLMLVFRSVLVPLKAAIMNLVSIAAAYGVVVAVFQWGWAKNLVGLDQTIPIVAFVPLVMFVILFGLSMDYEVFLMSRIKEEWDRTGDPRRSVVLGVAGTARVITTAALIMMAVFMASVTNPNPTVKLIGFGMAVAVLLDSTVVRMVLVPAVMELLGKRAWWFPKWLSWVPRLDVEGTVPPPPDGDAPARERDPELVS